MLNDDIKMLAAEVGEVGTARKTACLVPFTKKITFLFHSRCVGLSEHA